MYMLLGCEYFIQSFSGLLILLGVNLALNINVTADTGEKEKIRRIISIFNINKKLH